MLDNIKLKFNDKSLVENWFFENKEKFPQFRMKRVFIENIAHDTYPIIADVQNLELRICEKTAYLQGSLHKLFNYLLYNDLSNRYDENDNYSHLIDNNYNDFYYLQTIQALEYLKDFFYGLDLNNASISELEFGFNILTEKEPSEYKNMNFILYEYKAPQSNYSMTGNYFNKFVHCKHAFKVYSKKDQKGLSTNLLRIEIVLKSNHLKNIGINNFNDLFDGRNIENLYDFYCKKFDNFILIDNRQEKEGLSTEVFNEIGSYLVPSFWIGLKNSYNINRRKEKFNKLLQDYDMLNVKYYFADLIDKKFNQLYHGVVEDDFNAID